MAKNLPALDWYEALKPDQLPEGHATQVTCGHETVCMTHFEGQ